MRTLVLMVVAVLGCKSKAEETPVATPVAKPDVKSGELVKRGSLKRPPLVNFGVIIPAGTKPDPCEAAAKSVATRRGFEINSHDKPGRGLVLERVKPDQIGWQKDSRRIATTLVPDVDLAMLDQATVALRIASTNAAQDPKLSLDTAEVARAAAEVCHGWLIDEDTDRLLPLDQLAERVPGAKFDANEMMLLHMVPGENELGFIDTDGLPRLGLPELLITDVGAAQMRHVAVVLNATVQTLVERGDLTRDGELDIDLANLGPEWGAAEATQNGGTGKLTWKVRWAKSDHDESPILELFVAGSEPGNPVALIAAVSTFSGPTEDKVHIIDFQPELDVAAIQARGALSALRAHFAKGIPYNERLSIKAPFKTEHANNEWMWVDVYSFKRDKLEGSLANDPDDVPALKLGSRVTIKFSEVADFIHYRADKTKAGGYSFEVMRRHGEDVPALSDL